MIYIGNFLHLTNQQNQNETDRRHGEFHLIVATETVDQALALFKQRILDLRTGSSFFEGSCSIFLNQILGFDQISDQEAFMLNYKSVAGDPAMPFIGCSLPTEDGDDCRIFQWEGSNLKSGGNAKKLFVEFKAE
jgi:hypothetical protein